VTLLAGTDVVGSGVAESTGNYRITPALPFADGRHAITATATDAAGNTSAASEAINVTIDTQAPAVPTLALDQASDSGASDTDRVTNVATPTFRGSADADAQVTLLVDGVAQDKIMPTDGSYQFTLATALADGKHVITAQASDPAGNMSGVTPALEMTVDTAAPTVTLQQPEAFLARITFGFTASEADVTFECALTNASETTGAFPTCTSPQVYDRLENDSYRFQVRGTDLAGNRSVAVAHEFEVEVLRVYMPFAKR
jgi:hypothetical protein